MVALLRRLSVNAADLTRALQAALPQAALHCAQGIVRLQQSMQSSAPTGRAAPGGASGLPPVSDDASAGSTEEAAFSESARSVQRWNTKDQDRHYFTGTRWNYTYNIQPAVSHSLERAHPESQQS